MKKTRPLATNFVAWTRERLVDVGSFQQSFFSYSLSMIEIKISFFFPHPPSPSSLSKKKRCDVWKKVGRCSSKKSVVWSRTNLKEACSSWRRVNGLFSCVGVFWGVPGPLPEPLFFRTLFKGTAWNLGSFAGISSTLDVSMVGSGCDILGTYMLSSSSTSKSSSSSVAREE